mgnify:CR=1 FL=1
MKQGIFAYIDWGLLTPTLILVGISLITLLSIDITYFRNQLVYFVLSLVAFSLFSYIGDGRLIKK